MTLLTYYNVNKLSKLSSQLSIHVSPSVIIRCYPGGRHTQTVSKFMYHNYKYNTFLPFNSYSYNKSFYDNECIYNRLDSDTRIEYSMLSFNSYLYPYRPYIPLKDRYLRNDISSFNIPVKNNVVNNTIITNISYLPLPFKYNNYISGLMPLTKEQRTILNSDCLLGIESRKFLNKKMIHIMYVFSNKKQPIQSGQIYYAIESIFSNVCDEKMSKDLYKLFGKHLMPLTQSLCVYFFGNATFSYDTFRELCDIYNIRCESFIEQEIKISHFIELYFVVRLKKFMIKSTKFKGDYHIINPEGFRHMTEYFSELESMKQTGQKHSDLLIVEINNLKKAYDLLKLYIDMKSFVTFSTQQNRFSLFHPTIKNLQKYISDMHIIFTDYIKKNNILTHDPIFKYYKKLKEIQKEPLHPSSQALLHAKFTKMLHLLIEVFFKEDIPKLKLSFAIDAGWDKDYSEFYDHIIKPHLDKISEKNKIINDMIPEKSHINNKQHNTIITEFIDQILPEELKKDSKTYLESVILPKIKS